jgi:hypothetical protein
MLSDQFLCTKKAALTLGVSVSALEKGRSGYGNVKPPYVRIGRFIRYRLSDLHRWAEANTWGLGHGR